MEMFLTLQLAGTHEIRARIQECTFVIGRSLEDEAKLQKGGNQSFRFV